MKVLYFNNETIITKVGHVRPFAQNDLFPGTDGIQSVIDSTLLNDTELLREITSSNMVGDKLIPPEVFYFDEWDLEPFIHQDVGDFLMSVYPTIRQGVLGRPMFVERDGLIVVIGSTVSQYCSINKTHFSEPGRFPKVQTGHNAVPRIHPIAEDARSLIDELFTGKMGFSNLIRISCYRPVDELERGFILKSLKDLHMPAFIHCMLVGMRYARSNDQMYKHFRKRGESKVRDIWAPEPDVKEALRHMNLPLSKAYHPQQRARKSPQYAYAKGNSVVDNAKPHVMNKWMVKMDIRGFFDNCDWSHVKRYLAFATPSGGNSFMSSKEIRVLKPMVINSTTGGLYQGSPVSGALSNAILAPCIRYMENILRKRYETIVEEGGNEVAHSIAISVYADDITVSANFELKPKDMRSIAATADWVFEDMGMPFRLKPEKTRLCRNNGRLTCGVRINHLDQMTVTRRTYRLLKTWLEHFAHGKPVTYPKSKRNHSRGRSGKPVPKHVLKGHISWASMVDESEKIDRLMRRYWDCLKSGKLLPKKYLEGDNNAADGPRRESTQNSVQVDSVA